MRNFTLKSLLLGTALVASAAVSAQTITYQMNPEISQRIRQSHRTAFIFADLTKNGYMDIYYGGTSGANGWTTGGWLIQNEGNGQFQMIDEKNYEEYEETVWQRDEEGNIKTDEEGNWLPELNEDGTIKTETRTRETGMKNGLPKSAWCMGSQAFDFNQDGYVDLLIANKGGNDTGTRQSYQLVRNNGDGTFTHIQDEALASLGYGREGDNLNEGQEQLKVAVGDYNKDGYPDLLIEGWSDGRGRFVVLLKNVEGDHFEEQTGIFHPMAIENEINVHGLYETEVDEDGVELGYDYSNPTGNIIQCSHGPVGFADFDGDGWLDLFVTGWRDGVDGEANGKGNGGWDFRFYRNLQNGEFQDVTDQILLGGNAVGNPDDFRNYGGNLLIYPIDFNQDGKIDLYFNGDTGGKGKVALVFQNTSEKAGQFSFEPITVEGQAGTGDLTHRLFFFGDINADDYCDFYTDGWSPAYNGGDWGRTWQISDATGAYSIEAYAQGDVRPCPNGAHLSDGNIEAGAFGDFNGDGMIDIIVANWEDAPWASTEEGDNFGHCDNVYVSLQTGDFIPTAPDAPATVKAEAIENDDVKVTWDAVTLSNGNQPMYNLYIRNTETGATRMIAPANIQTGKQEAYTAFGGYVLGGEENSYIFTNLEVGTYEVGVQAVSYAYQGSAFTKAEGVTTDIKSVATGTASAPTRIYTVDGRQTNGRGHGLFIVRDAQGARKVLK